MYLKLFRLLHADDTVMFAESVVELQLALNIWETTGIRLQISILST
jgi:hypothetical protein